MSAGSSRILFSRPLSYAGLRVAMALAAVVASASVASAQSYAFSRLAGSSGGAGANDGAPAGARFFRPAGIAIDATGTIYLADTENHIIRKIAPTGQVSTLAGLAGTPGTVDGTGSAARFWRPTGIAVDQAGYVFVADSSNHAIRRITQAGAVSTFAGAPGSSGSNDGTGPVARFNIPNGLAIDGAGTIYVADTGNSTIRTITSAGVVSTFAGLPGVTGTSDGTGAGARFNQPEGVEVDPTTGSVYVADTRNHTIRAITPLGAVTTLAGLAGAFGVADGTGAVARFRFPGGLSFDGAGVLHVADTLNYKVRRVTLAGVVTTLAGSSGTPGTMNGTGSAAEFSSPEALVVDPANGSVYVADTDNHVVRKVTSLGAASTFAGTAAEEGFVDAAGTDARFYRPRGVAIDAATGDTFVADEVNHVIRRITSAGIVSTLAGEPGVQGTSDGTGVGAHFKFPKGLAIAPSGHLIVADTGSHTIRKVTQTGVVTTLAGSAGAAGTADGLGSAARFDGPQGVGIDASGDIYVADSGNHTIRKVTPAGLTSTHAGLAGSPGSTDGAGSGARFNAPSGVAARPNGTLFVADRGNSTIRRVSTTADVTTLAGMPGVAGSTDGLGSTARFTAPEGIAVDTVASIYVADTGSGLIRIVTAAGDVTTIGGGAYAYGSADGAGSAARFATPYGIAADATGRIVVADSYNHAIRTGTSSSPTATLTSAFAGNGLGTVKSTPAGLLCGTDCLETFASGQVVTLDAFASPGSAFTGWSGGGCTGVGECVTTLAASATVTATFSSSVMLTVSKAGSGSGTVSTAKVAISCGSDCTESFPVGTVVALTATASVGSTFAGWSGGGCSGTGSCVVTMTGVTSVVATFEALPPATLAVARSGTGSGTVTSNPAGISCGSDCTETYANGTVVTLAVQPAPGSYFVGWSGACGGSGGCVVTMSVARTVTAAFNTNPPPTEAELNLLLAGNGIGTVTSAPLGIACPDACMQEFPVGIAVTLGAVAGTGSTFEGWSGGGCSGTGPCTVVLSTSTSVTATFVVDVPTAATQTVYLAEGATSTFLDTRIALFNIDSADTVATLTFQPTGGSPIAVDVPVPAGRRITFDPKTVPGLAHAEFATKVESSTLVVVDRTMSWDVASGYGAHAETAVDAPALTWYLAEGATHSGFNLFYLLQNPNALATRVRVRFFTPAGAPLEKEYTLPPASRTNIWVNVEDFAGLGAALASTDVSASFECLDDRPIIVERALYLDRPGQPFAAGHESAGVTAPSGEWLLAEGATGDYFDLFVLVANTTSTDAAVEASFLLPSGTVVTKSYTVKANSRFNIWVDQQDPQLADTAVSTFVRSTNGVPIIVERALWWPGGFDQWYEAHNSPGATVSGVVWAMAEGEVGGARDIDTFILLANTSSQPTDVVVSLAFEDGTSAARTFTVSASSRFNVDVRTEFPTATGRRFGAVVESLGAPIVVERAMYWDANGQTWAAGTNALARLIRQTPVPR